MDDNNVYTDFYDHEDVNVKEVSIYYKNNMLELVLMMGHTGHVSMLIWTEN